MDISDMYENELNQEREREKTMTIEIAGMNLEIPEELVRERMERMYIDTMEENLAQIKSDGEGFYRCFKPGELKSVEDFNQKFVERTDEIVNLFRPI